MTDDTQAPETGLPKTFDPATIEARWAAHWEANGLFRPHRPDATPFTIVNPPPNVTGALHIGHALDNTLQDVLVRYERLRGKDALWVVGTDHAGIATQMVVERQMAERQQRRSDFSREDFVAKVWEWKAESGGQITGQLRRLGCSMDWANERFTMDEGMNRAVAKVFVDLYNNKDEHGNPAPLLYRAKRLVNWDPHFKSAISDLEVETREVQGHMWHFKYPLAGGETYTYVERDADGAVVLEEERDYIAIATTRPETMLGDGAVAVHPSDARYAPIVGKLCEIPVGPKAQRRLIPIITDDYPDPDFGSGAVKITGAHDQNDYGVAQRNGIPMYRLMDEVAALRTDGTPYAVAAERAKAIAAGEAASAAEIDALNLVPDAYRGLDRYEARKRVVADIDADGLMLRVEDKTIQQPFGDRSGVVIEPMLTDQWYVDAATLAKPAIEAVRSGKIEIVPKTWEKTFFNWMDNIQPWCVSRQLWWGHRIPAWFADDGSIFVAETEEEAQAQASEGVVLTRDEDVLDTWFSSALWPFATLGWPQENPPRDGEVARSDGGGGQPSASLRHESPLRPLRGHLPASGEDLLARHYPNDVLISGFDILFFWDARMMMQGLHFMDDVPWKTLYLHGLVRAPDGAKMAKSKGNVVNPLGLIDKYGADALRFFMSAMESQGRDIKMDDARLEGYRNFATKLWNAARFCQSNGIGASVTLAAPPATLPVNHWIIGETAATATRIETALAAYRFDDAANAIYQFAWGSFCDWYLELIKGQIDDETKAVAGWVLDQILVMLHPFMPFITEELWSKMGDRNCELIVAKWPEPRAEADAAASAEVAWLIDIISQVRSMRTELNIPWAAWLLPDLMAFTPDLNRRFAMFGATLKRMVRLANPDQTNVIDAVKPGTAQLVVGEDVFLFNLEDYVDVTAERARLGKALAAAQKDASGLAARLNNSAFTEKAKPEAVEKAREDYAARAAEAERLEAALTRLG